MFIMSKMRVSGLFEKRSCVRETDDMKPHTQPNHYMKTKRVLHNGAGLTRGSGQLRRNED